MPTWWESLAGGKDLSDMNSVVELGLIAVSIVVESWQDK